MSWMFAYIVAQPVSDWNMAASITDMSIMFDGASSFDQPIGTWNVSHVTDMSDMFYGVTLSTTNYNALLLDWSQETLQPGVSFDAGHSRYSSAAAAARASIISKFHWTITDGGLASPPIAGYPVGWTIGLLTLACVATATMKRRKFIQ
jgi:surface protein